ncbi:MAG: c-type cytochrome [Jaaginema sp. PMC 1079.18]|nr:c-type cytochrome [Jaaginema sp. PMC 1080.18]MEC4850337.1 c-type cytochrome [Jaaginema sp. PMC 1079.18]MEC4865590.1 c-type cytochrome [Jaaginema sp. PMC 1078.18]
MLKRIFWGAIASIFVSISFVAPAWAGDAAHGKQVFATNCASCHLKGKNAVVPAKTLQKDALEKYGMNSLEAIVTQVTNGKNAMPAFRGRLSATDMEDVATYVLAQAENGW